MEESKRIRKEQKGNTKTMNKMAINTRISIITLNVNGLNAPIKRHKVTNGYKNKTCMYTAHKRLTSDLKTYTDWKWVDEK